MQNVHRLRARRFLTEQQVLTAFHFYQDPNRFKLSPTLFAILREIVIEEVPLEKMEEQRGWPARSAKAILSILLFSMEETRGIFWSDADINPEVEELKATVDYITGDSIIDQADVMQRFRFTGREAKLFLILERAEGAAISKDTLLTRLYDDKIDDPPDMKIIDVFIFKVRQKLEGSGYRIDTIWGAGYSMTHEVVGPSKLQERDADWFVRHMEKGEPLREIARKASVQPSTVLRGVRREEERRAAQD